MMRCFINKKSGSNKFWNIEVKNKTLHIQYGRIASNGKLLIKEFNNKTSAQMAADKIIEEKLAKGYKEVSSVPEKIKQSKSAFAPMNKKMFWKLIDSSLMYTGLRKQAQYIQKALKQLSKKDLVAFENIYNKLENDCYSWNIWAAAYTIHKGCSDDSFTDFRAWLITRGQFVFENAMKSSDSLAALGKKVLAKSNEGECFLYLPGKVYEELYNSPIEKDPHIKQIKIKTTPSGKEWKEGDALALKKINPDIFKLCIGN